jgi:flagellar motility protein MotE (MotC chaperone)
VRDLSAYRKEQKEQLLQEIQSQWDAYQQAEQGITAQPEKSEQQTEQPQEKSEEQRCAEYYETLPPEQKAHVAQAVEYQQKSQAAEQIADTYAMVIAEVVGLLQGQTDRAFSDIKKRRTSRIFKPATRLVSLP